MIIEYFKNQITEIENSKLLRVYGAFLAGTHILAFILLRQTTIYVLSEKNFPNPWPFFEFMHLHRPVSEFLINIYFILYLISSCLIIFSFLKKERIIFAYFGLLTITLMKYFINMQDYALMGNYHYVSLMMIIIYLFIPSKKNNIPVGIFLIYFSAGLLKLNWEWISGSALFSKIYISDLGIYILCFYVVVLELFFSAGLLLASEYFWMFFVQFVGFHLFSYKFVGYYYPLTMGLILSYFLIQRYFKEFYSVNFSLKSTKFMVAFILFLQLIPAFYTGNSRLTGEGRIYSLNMFDSLPQCELKFVGIKNKEQVNIPFIIHHKARLLCDPLVFFNYSKKICETNTFERVQLKLKSKMHSEDKYKVVIDEQNMCESSIQYSIFQKNKWIK